jgi:hypothetical protein
MRSHSPGIDGTRAPTPPALAFSTIQLSIGVFSNDREDCGSSASTTPSNPHALRLAQARIAIQQASLVAAQEDLRVQQQLYELGASTQLELLTTQTQLNSARYNLVNARYQLRIARAQLEQLLGREIR